VRDDVIYLEMQGGCQGCGMAAVTLAQGIRRILQEALPEIRDIVDVTNHSAGDNPYY
jgi:Fe/S biogenesis protein NfuA